MSGAHISKNSEAKRPTLYGMQRNYVNFSSKKTGRNVNKVHKAKEASALGIPAALIRLSKMMEEEILKKCTTFLSFGD